MTGTTSERAPWRETLRVVIFEDHTPAGKAFDVILLSSRHKIVVFLGTILILVTILGAAMYLIEGEESGFTSIPLSVYWAVVTMTTVGYGDIIPQTLVGKTLAALVMVLGYSVIAVPTGIVTAEIVETAVSEKVSARLCPSCGHGRHATEARFCKHCGASLEVPAPGVRV